MGFWFNFNDFWRILDDQNRNSNINNSWATNYRQYKCRKMLVKLFPCDTCEKKATYRYNCQRSHQKVPANLDDRVDMVCARLKFVTD